MIISDEDEDNAKELFQKIQIVKKLYTILIELKGESYLMSQDENLMKNREELESRCLQSIFSNISSILDDLK